MEYLPEIKVNNPASNIIDIFLWKKILTMKKYYMECCSSSILFAVENRQEFYFFFFSIIDTVLYSIIEQNISYEYLGDY